MNYILNYINNSFVTIVLKVYSYRIARKEEKIQELRAELDYEVDSFRTILYSARWWSNEIKTLPTSEKKKQIQ